MGFPVSYVFTEKSRYMKLAVVVMLLASFLLLQTPEGSVETFEQLKENENIPYAYESLMKKAYYEASLVAVGLCREQESENIGFERKIFVITNVLAGQERVGESIAVNCEAEKGQYKLFYLKKAVGSVNGSVNYDVVDDCCFSLYGEMAELGETRVNISKIRERIEAHQNELTVPKLFMYYNGFEALIRACDAVIIGRIQKIEEYENVNCRTVDKGEILLRNLRISEVTVMVEDGLTSNLKKGKIIRVKVIENAEDLVIGAHDLFPVHKGARNEIFPGQYYVMMLIENDDPKNNTYFEVNPYQGFVNIEGEKLKSEGNEALFSIETMDEFIEKLNALNKYYYETER